MSSLKRAAAAALAAALEAGSPALANIEVLQQPPAKVAEYPTVAILPGRFPVRWWYPADELDANGEPLMLDPTTAVMRVGTLEGTMQVWCAARYPVGREELEDAVLQVFASGDAPGRLLVQLEDVTIAGQATTHDVDIAFILTDTAWREEYAFSERRWAVLEADVSLPVLTTKANAAVILSYELGLSRQLEVDLSGASSPAEVRALLSDLEEYAVDANGAVTAL